MVSAYPALRSQDSIKTEILALQRDTAEARWTSASTEIYLALNEALRTPGMEAHRTARVYTVTGGFDSGTYTYALPNYIRPPIIPQALRRLNIWLNLEVDDNVTSTYQEVPGWELEPNSTGSLVLRFLSMPYTADARILWFAPNGPVPTTVPTINTGNNISATDTSLVLNAALNIEDSGWVKIEGEWCTYAGVTRGASTTTLTIARAAYNTTAATHAAGVSVYWGVAFESPRLLGALYDLMRASLHAMYLTDGAEKETRVHEKLMNYYQQKGLQTLMTTAPSLPAPRLMGYMR